MAGLADSFQGRGRASANRRLNIVLMGMEYVMAPSTLAVSPAALIFGEVTTLIATLGVAYEGPDDQGNLKFRMPPGTPLLSQAEATEWARKIYRKIMESTNPAVREFIDAAPNFKIIAAR
jgi:hypothetical protein